jgi:GNAT superfamily N-acetyltransferase
MDDSEFRLSDGRTVLIRELTAADEQALRAALARADSGDLRRRFMGSPPPVRIMLELLRTADGVHDAALGAFTNDGRLVGVAQFDRADDRPSADVALEVAKDWQHGGLGKELSRRIALLAQANGIDTFAVNYLADNNAVAKLLDLGAGAAPPTIDAGNAVSEVDLASALATEGADDADRRSGG